ncbi:hypothetical protein CHS0354_030153 [Potamilus streckersoni]|uniref:Uncharacterized protein n=1 Tax=Potamilus streckersoni TaxID=2493646 RepID=A0AAE0SSV8_9BIVA|nr:hypothetical protein CHS0354_030153 [Potamilus streckersoni]
MTHLPLAKSTKGQSTTVSVYRRKPRGFNQLSRLEYRDSVASDLLQLIHRTRKAIWRTLRIQQVSVFLKSQSDLRARTTVVGYLRDRWQGQKVQGGDDTKVTIRDNYLIFSVSTEVSSVV